MIKQLAIYSATFLLVATIAFYIHQFALTQFHIRLPFSLKNIYFFHTGFSLVLCIQLFLLSQTRKFREQLGFLYLLSVALKIILFCIAFGNYIFSEETTGIKENSNLLIPMVLMLVLEVFFVSKLLKNQNPIKNT